MKNSVLDILHDHYKESFALIREREKSRNRLFLLVILLVGILFLQIQYPINFKAAIGNLKLPNASFSLDSLPLSSLLSLTWTFLFVITLQYCQQSINVERQYNYIHLLEEKISDLLGDTDVYRREGKAYIKDYPAFSNWTWIFYTFLFPLIMLISVVALFILEFGKLNYPMYFKAYDGIMGTGVFVSLILYRIIPLFQRKNKTNDSQIA